MTDEILATIEKLDCNLGGGLVPYTEEELNEKYNN